MISDAALVEVAGIEALEREREAWRALAARATQPNVFAQPEFLIPALRHLAPARAMTLWVWRDGTRSVLIGLVVLRMPPLGFGLARVWLSDHAGLAAAAFDHEVIVEALAALAAWLSRAFRGLAGLTLPAIEPEGLTAQALRALAIREAFRFKLSRPRRRAALVVAGVDRFEADLDKKRRKEWARQSRRLAERGRLEFAVAQDPEAIEAFLALEARGWKGARGTALNADPARLAFAREMLGAFAARGQLQIHRLALDGAPVGIGVALRAGARAFYWKTAYDEALAEFSPGVQLTLALSRGLANEPGLMLADSCALEDHPMIDRIWPGRIDLVDFTMALTPGAARGFSIWLALQRQASDARERLKTIVNRLLGRKRS